VTATITGGNNPFGIGFSPEPIDCFIARINALVAAGTLTQSQGNALIGKLEQVRAKIEGGQINAAINQLGALHKSGQCFYQQRLADLGSGATTS
jgi:hypothetical protein